MPFDIQGYYNHYKNYYGDAPLEDVAKDVYSRGGFDKEHPSYDAWKQSAGIDSHIQEDTERRKPKPPPTFFDKLRNAVSGVAPSLDEKKKPESPDEVTTGGIIKAIPAAAVRLGAGLASWIPEGLVNVADLAVSGLQGKVPTFEAGKKLSEAIQSILPTETPSVAAVEKPFLYPFQKLAEWQKSAGEKVYESTESPALAALTETAIGAVPFVGVPFIGKGIKAVKGEKGALPPEHVVPQLNDIIDTGLKTGQIGEYQFSPEDAVAIIRQAHKEGYYQDAHIDEFKQAYPQLRDGLNEVIADRVKEKVNQAAAPVMPDEIKPIEAKEEVKPGATDETVTTAISKEPTPAVAAIAETKTTPAETSMLTPETKVVEPEASKEVTPEIKQALQKSTTIPVTQAVETKIATKDTLKAKLDAGEIEDNAPVRLTTIDELRSIIKKGELTVGKDFEGRSGISAQKINKEGEIVAYGANDKISAAIIFPKESIEGIGVQPNEVTMKPETSIDKLRFIIDGHEKILSLDELRELYKEGPRAEAGAVKETASEIKGEPFPRRMEALEKKKGKSKGPEGIIGYIKTLGGMDLSGDYNTKQMKEWPDLRRVHNAGGQSPDELAQILKDEGYVGFDTGDELVELLKSGQARNLFTPDKQDVMINYQIRRLENEWLGQELATLEQGEGINAGATREGLPNLKDRLSDEIRAEGVVEETNHEAALKELEDYFQSVTEKPSKKFTEQTTEIPGTGYADNFNLVNPGTETGRLPEESVTKTGSLALDKTEGVKQNAEEQGISPNVAGGGRKWEGILPEVREEHARRVGDERQGISQDVKAPYRLREACKIEGQGLSHYPEGYDMPEFREAHELAASYGLGLIPIKDTTNSFNAFISGKDIFVRMDKTDRPLRNIIAHEISHKEYENSPNKGKIDINSQAFIKYRDYLSKSIFGEDDYNRGYRIDIPLAHEEYLAELESGMEQVGDIRLGDGLKQGETVEPISLGNEQTRKFSFAEATQMEAGRAANKYGQASLKSLMPGIEAMSDIKQGAQSLVLPTAKSKEHLAAAETIGKQLGAMNRDNESAAAALRKDELMFTKMGVHNPDMPLTENPGMQFASDVSQGKSLSPEMEPIANRISYIFQKLLKALDDAGVGLEKVRENYFPGMWTKESVKAFNQALNEAFEEGIGGKDSDVNSWTKQQKDWVKNRSDELLKEGKGSDQSALSYLTRRPFKGKESFRKQKTFDDIMTAVEFGLKPVSTNPIELVKLKLSEMGRSLMANRALRDFEAKGDVKRISPYEQVPEGWQKINDKYGTIYGPPTITTKEFVDRAVYDGMSKVAADLGVEHKRVYDAGRGKLGYASPLEGIVTQFATETSVLAHEIGHQLDFKYGLWDRITGGERGNEQSITQKELRALADLTWEGQEASKYYKQKVRKQAEKMAHMLEAYIHAPEKFKEVAPTVYGEFDSFIKSKPELKPLSEIKPGIALKELQNERYVGLPIMGYRIAKAPVADIMNNYLSSSIYNSPYFGKAFKAYMGTANILNQSQLGVLSAFHAGFTSAEVAISQFAEAIKDVYGLARGNRTFGDVAKSVGKIPGAFVRTPMQGAEILKEWETPTMEVPSNVALRELPNTKEARTAIIARSAEIAGGGFKMEYGLKSEWSEKMIQEWYGGEKVKAALRSPVAFTEMMAKPILEWLVPRQKAGVFGELVGRLIEMNPEKTLEQLTPELRQAWNRIDARLGRVRYDRLFINNMAKNSIQALIRAPGWSGGTIGEIGGSLKDAGKFLKEWAKSGKAPENIPDRVAYTVALMTGVATANGLLTYLFTGDKPEGADYWAFRDGGKDEHGRPSRWVLPTYQKDVYAYMQDPGHVLLAKTHPLIGLIGDVMRNKDYYGVKITKSEDSPLKKGVDIAKYGVKAFVPFWIRGAQKETERGGGLMKTLQESPAKILAPEVGIMPAASAYTSSPFEKYAQGLHEKLSKTTEEFERSKLKSELAMAIRRGDTDAREKIMEARQENKITHRDVDDIKKQARTDPLLHLAQHMSLEELTDGLKYANDREKAILVPLIRKKFQTKARDLGPEDRKKYYDLIRGFRGELPE